MHFFNNPTFFLFGSIKSIPKSLPAYNKMGYFNKISDDVDTLEVPDNLKSNLLVDKYSVYK